MQNNKNNQQSDKISLKYRDKEIIFDGSEHINIFNRDYNGKLKSFHLSPKHLFELLENHLVFPKSQQFFADNSK